jgi:hypothetical protein
MSDLTWILSTRVGGLVGPHIGQPHGLRRVVVDFHDVRVCVVDHFAGPGELADAASVGAEADVEQRELVVRGPVQGRFAECQILIGRDDHLTALRRFDIAREDDVTRLPRSHPRAGAGDAGNQDDARWTLQDLVDGGEQRIRAVLGQRPAQAVPLFVGRPALDHDFDVAGARRIRFAGRPADETLGHRASRGRRLRPRTRSKAGGADERDRQDGSNGQTMHV